MPEGVTAIFFSPTGTTRKTVRAFSKAFLGGHDTETVREYDLTRPASREEPVPREITGLLVLGFPVYEERIPVLIRENIESLCGKDTPAVIIAVYGGMGFGISLKEARDILKNNGFHVVGAAACLGEHSFATPYAPLASGRPDAGDLEGVTAFGVRVRDLLADGIPETPYIPGRLPLQARILPGGSAKLFSKVPVPDPETCTACGVCVNLCPVGAIDETTFTTDDEACIRCFSCSNVCPRNARSKEYRNSWLVRRVLNHANRHLPEPAFFLP